MNDKQITFTTVADLTSITVKDFERFLPDFVTWFYAAKSIQDLGGIVYNMTWIDDGKPGGIVYNMTCIDDGKPCELSGIDIRTPDGQVERIQVGGTHHYQCDK